MKWHGKTCQPRAAYSSANFLLICDDIDLDLYPRFFLVDFEIMVERTNITHCVVWENLSFNQTVQNRLLCASGYVVGVFPAVGSVVPEDNLDGRVNGLEPLRSTLKSDYLRVAAFDARVARPVRFACRDYLVKRRQFAVKYQCLICQNNIAR